MELFAAAEELLGPRWRQSAKDDHKTMVLAEMARLIAGATSGTRHPRLTTPEVLEWLTSGFPGWTGRRRRAEGTSYALVVAWEQRRRGEPVRYAASREKAARERLALDPTV